MNDIVDIVEYFRDQLFGFASLLMARSNLVDVYVFSCITKINLQINSFKIKAKYNCSCRNCKPYFLKGKFIK